MPQASPQRRFLVRGSALMISLLVLWWFVLLNPLLFLLKGSAEFCGELAPIGLRGRLIAETPNGDWSFEIPLEAIAPGTSEHPAAVSVHSVSFDLARSDAGAFTFGLPVFWALMVAAPGLRRNIRPLLLGTLVMGFVQVVLLLAFVEIFAHKSALQWWPPPDSTQLWLLHFGEYLLQSAIPYLAPFVIALWLHRELRWQMFHWGMEPGVAAVLEKRGRRRK